jgi:hypothetical protein
LQVALEAFSPLEYFLGGLLVLPEIGLGRPELEAF